MILREKLQNDGQFAEESAHSLALFALHVLDELDKAEAESAKREANRDLYSCSKRAKARAAVGTLRELAQARAAHATYSPLCPGGVEVPPVNAIRWQLCHYSPRRDGHADKFINHWLSGQRGRASNPLLPPEVLHPDNPARLPLYATGKGTLLNSEDKRDALVAALWGVRKLLSGRGVLARGMAS